MRLLLLSISLLLNFPAAAFAECDCIWGGPFTEVQGGTDIVIAGTVIGAKGNSVDLSVDQLIRGTEYLPEIRVWMNPGQLCRPESEEFPRDSQWVMALHRVEQLAPGDFNPRTPNRSAGRVGDYSLSSCGGYWLSLNGNLVTGNLAGGGRWQRDPPMSPVLLEPGGGLLPKVAWMPPPCGRRPPLTRNCSGCNWKHACSCASKIAAQSLSRPSNSSSIIRDIPQMQRPS